MARHLALACLLLPVAAACNKSTTTAPTPTPTPGGPTAAFTLRVDDLDGAEALVDISRVSVDLRGSTGDGLRYRIDFGDGTTSTEASSVHTYRTAGTYRVTGVVTDTRNQSTTAAADVVVVSPLGRWVASGFAEGSKRVEVRALAITSQSGDRLTGELLLGKVGRKFTASVSARQVRFTFADSPEVLDGTVPRVISADGASWPMSLTGRAAFSEALIFRRVIAEPSGAAPDATIHMRFFSFSAPFAVKQISPILFDASPSRGEGLNYFIEFGDGQFVNGATVTHPIERSGEYQATVTIVDRFGRMDSESFSYLVRDLVTRASQSWGAISANCPVSCGHVLRIDSQEGTEVTGRLSYNDRLPPFHKEESRLKGTIGADGRVRLDALDWNLTLVGTLTMPTVSLDGSTLVLTYEGGSRSGLTIQMARWDQ